LIEAASGLSLFGRDHDAEPALVNDGIGPDARVPGHMAIDHSSAAASRWAKPVSKSGTLH